MHVKNFRPFGLVFILGALLLMLALSQARVAHAATTTATDWFWEYPLPQGNTLHGVSCPTTTLCKAVGDAGDSLFNLS